MNLIHALVLGTVQGFTEILPISSSAHLILLPWLLGWPESGLTFDVALHLGTFIALSIYFRQDIIELVSSFFGALSSRSLDSQAKRLPVYIIVGTFPAAIVGKLFEQRVEDLFRSNLLLIASFLIVFGLLLGLSDRIGTKQREMGELSWRDAMLIGLFQCLALIPGVSRSGITITTGLMLGFTRDGAARFSFLLSIPIVAGAALLKFFHLLKHGIPAGEGPALLIGIAASALASYISVDFLLKFVQKRSIAPFVWYRIVAGAGLVVAIMAGFGR